MKRDVLISQTIKKIKQLPDYRLKEVNSYVDFLLSKIDDQILLENIKDLSMQSDSFDFLNDDEELYEVSDVKEHYQ
ncbi:MAG: hypothetical protein ACQESK_05280 [Bacteroidota bacterium]